MDTEWATGSMHFSRPRSDYDVARAAVLGSSEVPWPSRPGETGGGAPPAEIAQRLVQHIMSAEPGPLRLVLGADATSQIRTVLDQRMRDSMGESDRLSPGSA